MSNFEACQEQLLAYSRRRGYLTFDDVLDAASTFSLSLSEIDRLSDNLQSLGVMLLESAPTPKAEDASEFVDYTRTDYDEVFSEILSLSETLEPLINTIKEIPPPQYREIQTLTEQIQYGNLFARERLILLHLRVATKIALSIAKQYSYPIEDAISASFIGLVEAVEHFDPNGFSAFLSYASMWIQQNIHRYCTPTWMKYYCPTHFREKLFPAILKYTSNSGTIIVEDEYDFQTINNIAYELGIEEQTVTEYLLFAYNQAMNHINSDVLWHPTEDYDEILSVELEAQTRTDDNWLFDAVAQKELSRILPTIISTLTPREQLILRMRFGLYDGVPKTLEEVGREFDITKERVRQIEKKCIRQLRHPSRAKRIKDFYC